MKPRAFWRRFPRFGERRLCPCGGESHFPPATTASNLWQMTQCDGAAHGKKGAAAVALEQVVAGGPLDPATRENHLVRVRERLFQESTHIIREHIERISTTDVQVLFDLLDGEFFGGLCQRTITERNAHLGFRLARRMTSAGGRCAHWRESGIERYEIAISTHVMFENFHGDVARDVVVNGLPCHGRLDCLMRIMEHEMGHLIEFLLWGESDCSAPRFFGIVNRHFGHTATKHQMVTRRERAARVMNVRPGSPVQFEFGGRTLFGIVNRITTRATVLVESPDGLPYSDGKRYKKFYVPLSALRLGGPA